MTNAKPGRYGGIKFLIVSSVAAAILALWNYFAGLALAQNPVSTQSVPDSHLANTDGINMSALPTLADLLVPPSSGVKPADGSQTSSSSSTLRTVNAVTPAPAVSAPVVVSGSSSGSGTSSAPVTTTQSSR